MKELLRLEALGLIERNGFRRGQVIWVAVPRDRMSESAHRILTASRIEAPSKPHDLS